MRSKSGIRIAGSVGATTAPMSSPVENGMSNATDATVPVTSAVIDHPGHGEQADPDGDAAEHADRELQPAVEEDERHAERQEELGARRVERDVDGVGDRRPEHRPAEEEDEHARRADRVRDELADETRDEHDPEREDDVLRRHRRDSLPCGGGAETDGR